MFFHLCLISSGVHVPDICQEDPKAFLCYYHIIFWILVPLDPRTPSLFLLWLVLRVLELLLLELDQVALLLLASRVPRVPILEAARRPLPGLN